MISSQNDVNSLLNRVRLPKIHSTRAHEVSTINMLQPPSKLAHPITRRNENLDPIIYMSKDLTTPKQSLVPKVERYNLLNHHHLPSDLVSVSSNAAILEPLNERISPIR